MKNTKQVKEKKGFIKTLIILVLIAIIILLCMRCGNQRSKKPIEVEQNVNAITEIDYSDRQEYVDTKVEEGMININYLPKAIFEGKTSIKFNVKNIKNNKGPIVFEIYDEEENCIYQSKLIEPGYEMNSIKLDKPLKKGTHDCKIKVGYAEDGNVDTVFPIMIEVR